MELFERTADRRLVKRFGEGDRDAFTTLYRTHQPAVYRFALYMTGDPDASAEITQETFVWLINHPGQFDPDRGTLGAFLSGVARNLLRRRDRDGRRWRPLKDAQHTGSAGRGSMGCGSMDSEIEAANLRQAISVLPGPYREAVVLCDLGGSTYEEAAGVLGCAVGTIRSRLHRARQLLARKLQIDRQTEKCCL